MSTTELVTFEIVARDMPRFEAEFRALAKKAKKLKVEEPTFEVLGSRVVPAEVRACRTGETDDFGRPITEEVLRPGYEVKIVRVSGPAPKLAGWSFIAVLQHEEAGNIIRHVPGTDATHVARDYRTAAP